MKNLNKIMLIFTAMFVLISVSACTKKEQEEAKKEYKYITADELKTDIESGKEMILLDIQPEEDYNAHHIIGTIPTYAYPMKTDEDKLKMEAMVTEFKENDLPIIIVCPGGGGGATNTYDYLEENGIDVKRMLILEKGQKGWPHEDLLEK